MDGDVFSTSPLSVSNETMNAEITGDEYSLCWSASSLLLLLCRILYNVVTNHVSEQEVEMQMLHMCLCCQAVPNLSNIVWFKSLHVFFSVPVMETRIFMS